MSRFFRRGVTVILAAPAVADISAPSRAEITAATDLSEDIADIAGWQLNNSPIPVPNLADSFTSQIEGEDTVADSSLTFYDRTSSDLIRTTLAKGTEIFVIIMPYGDVPTERCQVYQTRSTGVNDEFSLGNDAARFAVGFAILDTPDLEAVIPAAA